MTRALVLGAAGFIGAALSARLKSEGCYVAAVDYRDPPFGMACDDFSSWDLRRDLPIRPRHLRFDEVYQLAADLGGAGYIFSGQHDADVIRHNVLINASAANTFSKVGCGRLLFTSSACVYNDALADDLNRAGGYVLNEDDAGERGPSSPYGWEKLFSEQLYLAHKRNYGLDVCIARFATIYGPGCAFDNGRENAVAAICRKVIDAPNGGEVEVWGDGEQVRPLVFIDDLLDAMTGLMRSKTFDGPINVATTELTTCNEIAQQAIALSGKRLTIKNVPGPTGKQVLNMSTELAEQRLGWKAKTPFSVGLEKTFEWIAAQKMQRAA